MPPPAALGSKPPLQGAIGARSDRLTRLKARIPKPGEASFFFYDAHFKNAAVKVLPGEYFVDNEDLLVMTTLGSCIAACLWDRHAQIGGMNHFMLPETGETDLSGAAGRYGTYAMELLINELMKKGARRDGLEAKLFGGGNVMRNFTTLNVGERNAAFAEKFLETERIRVTAKDLLDIYPRKVVFFTHSGRALIKKLKEERGDNIAKIETKYKSTLAVAKPATTGGDIELF